ncbi:MAG TPA: lamin tail domain-containing protein, partial [Humibacter sp.]|nr:lamin tail domain-containing protein [Humibacter sp.]
MRTQIRRVSRGAAVAVAVLGVISGSLAVTTAAQAEPSGSIVVNEVYGGGGNSGSTYTNDFVELTNRGSAAVDLTGWSVQYHAKAATGTWQVTRLTGSIAAGGFYVVAEAKGSGGTTPLPQSDATGSI